MTALLYFFHIAYICILYLLHGPWKLKMRTLAVERQATSLCCRAGTQYEKLRELVIAGVVAGAGLAASGHGAHLEGAICYNLYDIRVKIISKPLHIGTFGAYCIWSKVLSESR
jgi:hypothetical protein